MDPFRTLQNSWHHYVAHAGLVQGLELRMAWEHSGRPSQGLPVGQRFGWSLDPTCMNKFVHSQNLSPVALALWDNMAHQTNFVIRYHVLPRVFFCWRKHRIQCSRFYVGRPLICLFGGYMSHHGFSLAISWGLPIPLTCFPSVFYGASVLGISPW